MTDANSTVKFNGTISSILRASLSQSILGTVATDCVEEEEWHTIVLPDQDGIASDVHWRIAFHIIHKSHVRVVCLGHSSFSPTEAQKQFLNTELIWLSTAARINYNIDMVGRTL